MFAMISAKIYIIVYVIFLFIVQPSIAYSSLVDEAGPFDIYKVNNNTYYAIIDPNNFDYVYNDRLYVIKYYEEDDFAFRYAILNTINKIIKNYTKDNINQTKLLYPNDTKNNELLRELKDAGINAINARILATNNMNFVWAEIMVPNDSIINIIIKTNTIFKISKKYADIDIIILIGSLWPPNMTFSEIHELGVELFDNLVSQGVPLIGVGGAYGIPLIISINGIETTKLGLTESDVLEQIDRVLPEQLSAVVEIYYFNKTITFDIGTSNNEKYYLIYNIIIFLVLTIVVAMIFIKSIK